MIAGRRARDEWQPRVGSPAQQLNEAALDDLQVGAPGRGLELAGWENNIAGYNAALGVVAAQTVEAMPISIAASLLGALSTMALDERVAVYV